MKKEFIETLAIKRSVYLDEEQSEIMANLLDTVSSDIYSQNIRFVFELIQNADDAGNVSGNEVRFDFFGQAIVVSHNGRAFSEKDISSLASAGKSQKEDDPNTTGYKGIGFKSVFGRSKRVTISSNGYCFRFDKHIHSNRAPWQIIPVWTTLADLPEPVVAVLSAEYSVSTVIEMKDAARLQPDLEEILTDGRILLFLRKVNKVVVAANGSIAYSIEKKLVEENAVFKKIDLCRDGERVSSWLVKTFPHIPIPENIQAQLAEDEDTPPKLKRARQTELSIAAKITGDEIEPVHGGESLIFTYLPTKVTAFQFPFLVNSNFLTNAPREALHEDHPWNAWLMTLTAQKLIDWLKTWAGTAYKFQLLKLFPLITPGLPGLKGILNAELLRQIRQEAFIPSNSLILKKAAALVVDRTGLSGLNFIDQQAFINFINREKDTQYGLDCFVHPDLAAAGKLEALGSLFYDIEHLPAFFLSPEFTRSHQPAHNSSLIRYFFQQATGLQAEEWKNKLAEIPFIFSASGSLKAPQAVCFPGIAYQTDFGAGVAVINGEVYADIQEDRPLLQWMESLGVKEPSELAYIENEIIANITTCVTSQNYLQLTRFLFRRFQQGILTTAHLARLGDLKIKTTKDGFEPAKLCFLSDFYQPELRLEKVNNACHFVFSGYCQQGDLSSEWKTFFLRLGTAEKIGQIRMNLTQEETRTKYPDFIGYFQSNNTLKYLSRAGNTWSNPALSYKIESYSLFEFATEYAFSKVFWEQIFKTTFERIGPDTATASLYDSPNLKENFFEWSLKSMAIIPTSLKTCEMAANVFINDPEIVDTAGAYLSVLDYDQPLSESWRRLFALKTSLVLEDYLHILEQMAATHDRSPVTRADQRRLGQIYNRLADLIPNLSPEKETFLSTWAGLNRLPCTSLHFVSTHTLKLVNVPGFNTSTDNLKVMLLPENSRPNTPEFKTLIRLLGIPEIDSFTPDFGAQEPKANISLKNKLLTILPYFALIVAKKTYGDLHGIFNVMHKSLLRTQFFVVEFARLTFTDGQQTVAGPELNTYKDQTQLYFKGDWRKPLVLYALLPELLTIFEVRGLSEELRLLLDLEQADIEDYFTAQGLDIHSTTFLSAKQSIQLELAEEPIDPQQEVTGISEIPVINIPMSPAESPSGILAGSRYSDEETTVDETPFAITSDASDNNVTTVIKSRSYSQGIIIQTEIQNYAAMHSQESREKAGRWSEQRVFTVLSTDTEYGNLTWVNQTGETGLPYDLTYWRNGQQRYIDVKGTPSAVKDVVFLSGPEWAFMLANGQNYSIYRLFKAGTEQAHIEIVDDPAGLLLADKLRPETVTLQL